MKIIIKTDFSYWSNSISIMKNKNNYVDVLREGWKIVYSCVNNTPYDRGIIIRNKIEVEAKLDIENYPPS